MKDVASIIKNFLEANWTEDTPGTIDIKWAFDEYNPNDPSLQILLENMPDKKTFITRNYYRIEHSCKISIFVRPVNYLPTTIETYKVTFNNMKTEIDRILNVNRFGLSPIYSVTPEGWRDIDFEVGRDSKGKTGKEPITFIAEQVIRTIYYEGDWA